MCAPTLERVEVYFATEDDVGGEENRTYTFTVKGLSADLEEEILSGESDMEDEIERLDDKYGELLVEDSSEGVDIMADVDSERRMPFVEELRKWFVALPNCVVGPIVVR
jgi:hypothetical protein